MSPSPLTRAAALEAIARAPERAGLALFEGWSRHRALLHVLSKYLDVPAEVLEREVDDYISEHGAALAHEVKGRLDRFDAAPSGRDSSR